MDRANESRRLEERIARARGAARRARGRAAVAAPPADAAAAAVAPRAAPAPAARRRRPPRADRGRRRPARRAVAARSAAGPAADGAPDAGSAARRGAGRPRADRSAHPRPASSLRDLEERFAGRALAWVGGLALVAAAIFFLSLAFSRGWITEPMRVLIGLAAAVAALVLGAVSARPPERR